MPKQLTVYECVWCEKRRYVRRGSCLAHERRCFWNPVMHGCITCDHLSGDFGKYHCYGYPSPDGIHTHSEPLLALTYGCLRWRQSKYPIRPGDRSSD